MFTLVFIAYISGEVDFIKASPVLYDTLMSCEKASARVIELLYANVPEDIKGVPYVISLCTQIPEEA
tara:strand:- start:483 stop:683 length:201 start_codon:yes stop_codon:yes gene_type:complete